MVSVVVTCTNCVSFKSEVGRWQIAENVPKCVLNTQGG